MIRGRKINRYLAKLVSRLARPNLGRIAIKGGIVSFTFDDFPKSAFVAGGRILEKFGARGTYYTCMQFAGMDREGHRMFDTDDVREAHQRGHEIACHSYSHLDCAVAKVEDVLADTMENAEALSSVLGCFTPANFAYPYAQVGLRSKLALVKRFMSCRGTRPGINMGKTDLGELRANEIRKSPYDHEAFRRLIAANAVAGGWLIFCTHDVADDPSPFGCTPSQFEAVVAQAAANNGRILSVREALKLIHVPGS
jgi:peptidoglycan/xylan/chitin deacetylase (PgdA/CDA1 family)